MSSAETSKPDSRFISVDMAKGIAIFLVVFAHALRGLIKSGNIPTGSAVLLIDYVIYTFHMPIFFVFAGYFFKRVIPDNEGLFWWSRLKSILYPYFLWSLVHGGLQVAFSGSGATNGTMDASRLLEIVWAPIIPYWFLYALFFSYVLGRISLKVSAELLCIFSLCFFLFSFYALPGVIKDIGYGFFYFSIGIVARKYNVLSRMPRTNIALIITFIFFLISALLSYDLHVPERLPIVSAILGIIFTTTLCIVIEERFRQNKFALAAALIGQCSMGIYVMHIIVLAFSRTVIVKILHITNEIALLSTITLLAVLVPLAVQVLAITFNVEELIAMPTSGRMVKRRYNGVFEKVS